MIPSAIALKGVHEYVLPLYRQQEQSGQRGKAHNAQHQYAVAFNAAQRAEALAQQHGLSAAEREHVVNLAWLMGITHDLVRNPAEKAKSTEARLGDTDGFATTLELWHSKQGRGNEKLREALSHLEKRDVASIGWAILENERPNEQVAEKIRSAYKKGSVQHAILLDALTFGDKAAQGTGPTVVKRRAEFVSGERHDNPEDLAQYAHNVLSSEQGRDKAIDSESKTRLLVYVLESLLRIHGLKPVSGFPEGMRQAVQEKRSMENEVYFGVLKHLGFTSENELLKFGLTTGYPNLEANKKTIERELASSKSENVLKKLSKAAATQAAKLVLSFAYAQVTQKFEKATGAHASRWMQQIEEESKAKPTEEIGKRFFE